MQRCVGLIGVIASLAIAAACERPLCTKFEKKLESCGVLVMGERICKTSGPTGKYTKTMFSCIEKKECADFKGCVAALQRKRATKNVTKKLGTLLEKIKVAQAKDLYEDALSYCDEVTYVELALKDGKPSAKVQAKEFFAICKKLAIDRLEAYRDLGKYGEQKQVCKQTRTFLVTRMKANPSVLESVARVCGEIDLMIAVSKVKPGYALFNGALPAACEQKNLTSLLKHSQRYSTVVERFLDRCVRQVGLNYASTRLADNNLHCDGLTRTVSEIFAKHKVAKSDEQKRVMARWETLCEKKASKTVAVCGGEFHPQTRRVRCYLADKIAGLDALGRLRKLTDVHIASPDKVVDLSDLGKLSKLPSLTLTVSAGQPLAFLKEMSGLRRLGLNGSKLTSIAPLKVVAQLTSLDLTNSKIADIQAVASLTDLETLILTNSKVVDLEPVKALTKLKVLDLSDSEIKSIKPLTELTALEKLVLRESKVTDIGPLKGSKTLKTLDVAFSQIYDVTPLHELKSLQTLVVSVGGWVRDDRIDTLKEHLPKLTVKKVKAHIPTGIRYKGMLIQ